MENDKTYGIKEAAEKLGISWATIRRRIADKTLPAVFVSRREGYKIKEEDLNKFAQEQKAKSTGINKDENKGNGKNKKTRAKKGEKVAVSKKSAKAGKTEKVAETVVKENVKEVAKDETAKKETVEKVAQKAEAKAKARAGIKPVNKSVNTAKPAPVKAKSVSVGDTTTEMLVGGQLGLALSAIMGAYSDVGELSLPENEIRKLIKELNSVAIIDKVIERLKAEREYFDIQSAAKELKIQQTSKKDEKVALQNEVIELRLKKNQIGKDITDLEIRKALLS